MRLFHILAVMTAALALSACTVNAETKTAAFAGGCFWCMEPPFEKLDGVKSVISGYMGGTEKNPTYEEVSSGKTGHLESVLVTYEPKRISYKQLLDVYWRQIDPTDPDGQFVDRGRQYRSAIFYQDAEQKRLAEASKREIERSGVFKKPIVTGILKAGEFYPAEYYHQDYYTRNPVRYKYYRYRSGRDQFLEKTWRNNMNTQGLKTEKKYTVPSDAELRKTLTPMQYRVAREEGTEPPFKNEYWDNHREGIYVDIVSGEPLFSSKDKYESGTGWPSFTRPLAPDNIVEKTDRSIFMTRTEIRSRYGDSHLGHVFNDGPAPTGLRYCMNSASLRFVPVEDLEKEGYGEYRSLFK